MQCCQLYSRREPSLIRRSGAHGCECCRRCNPHSLGENLRAVLVQEAQFLGGVQVELQYLKYQRKAWWSSFRILLREIEYEHGKKVKIRMKLVRELVYDVEDCLDDFKHHLGTILETAGVLEAADLSLLTGSHVYYEPP